MKDIMFKPMLSGKAPDNLSQIKYPVAVSPKLDGFRAIVIGGVLYSRNMKPIRNKFTQERFGKFEYEGYDGELIVGDPTSKTCFRDTSSGVTSYEGEPDVKFYVFDKINEPSPWYSRYLHLEQTENVLPVNHFRVQNENELIEWEQLFLADGYEGLMIRSGEGPYKQGRSTTKEGYLLKLKRFEDSEAYVLGMEEKMHNANEATKDELGRTKRTSHQAYLVGMDTMGALMVKDVKTGVEFNIGTGFDDETRKWWWNLDYIGHDVQNAARLFSIIDTIVVKYRFFPQGSKDKPRFPTYLGIRDKDDL